MKQNIENLIRKTITEGGDASLTLSEIRELKRIVCELEEKKEAKNRKQFSELVSNGIVIEQDCSNSRLEMSVNNLSYDCFKTTKYPIYLEINSECIGLTMEQFDDMIRFFEKMKKFRFEELK